MATAYPNGHADDTQTSNSNSGISDLSALENETDDFGRRLLQHQRDAQRLKTTIHGGREQAFRKARPKPRVAERLEREERVREHERSASGGSSEGSEPPVSVPREWGRRGRRQGDWMRKIVAPSEDGREIVGGMMAVENGRSMSSGRSAPNGDLDWKSGVNRPLESVLNTPPSMRRVGGIDTPSSLNHMNTTLRPGLDDFEDQDLSAVSFLASTPAPVKYHRKIDELARREIEDLENQAVTTRTLNQIDKTSPNATRRRTSNSRARERALADAVRLPTSRPAKSISPSRITARRHLIGSNKENIPVNGDVMGDIKTEHPGLVEDAPMESLAKSRLRPSHSRNDSMNLLRKLARVSSLSPSPARPSTTHHDMPSQERHESAGEDNKGHEEQRSELVTIEERFQRHRVDAKFQSEIKEGQVVDSLRRKTDYDEAERQQPLEDRDRPVNAAQKVAGGWEDSMLDAVDESQAKQELEEEAQIDTIIERVAHLRPNYPRSALEAIVREAKATQDAQPFGDSTIQSLEDIVHPELVPADTTLPLDIGKAGAPRLLDEADEAGDLTQAERDRRQEDLAMEAMDKHLRTAGSSIKDAQQGLRRVEHRFEEKDQDYSQPGLMVSQARATVMRAKAASSGLYCTTCGCHEGYHGSAWGALWTELRSCFYYYDQGSSPLSKHLPNVRFTGLGLAILICWAWYVCETTLCDVYCHSRYAWEHETAREVDPDAPRWPYVIPTLLFRPFRRLWEPLWEPLVESTGVALHYLAGQHPSFQEPIASPLVMKTVPSAALKRTWSRSVTHWAASTATVADRVVHSVLDAVDGVGYMWNDEMLS